MEAVKKNIVENPYTKTKLKDFQVDGVVRIEELHNLYKKGIVLSETGVGKTIQMLTHIFLRLKENPDETNLIICPSHLVVNWSEEIGKHFNFSSDSINIFHGPGRIEKKVSIVITSYLLAGKLKEKKYSRIILDEAHYIRNKKTTTFANINNLQSDCKWLMTATPIFNEAKELKSYFMFLNLDEDNITSRIVHKYSLYQKKDLLNLPEKNDILVELNLSKEEKEYHYDIIEIAKNKIKTLQELSEKNKDLKKFFKAHILTIISKLRQSCNSCDIITQNYDVCTTCNDKGCKGCIKGGEELEDCPVCWDGVADTKSSCNHKLCRRCWDGVLNISHSCPMCRRFVSHESLVSNTGKKRVVITKTLSSKLEKLIEIVKNKKNKIIISSQWISSLDLIEKRLKKENIGVLRIDGSITDKNKVLKKFKEDCDKKILLVSLTCCAEGLTIVEAKTIIHFEYWWNPQKTHQLSSRIHRIGQESNVDIITLRTQGTIEYMMRKINMVKNNLGQVVLKSNDDDVNDNKYKTRGIITKILKFDKNNYMDENLLDSEDTDNVSLLVTKEEES